MRKYRGHPGVYSILNTKTGKSYIGSSWNVFTRWMQHAEALKAGWHHVEEMQKTYNKNGIGAFTFSVIEIMDDSRSPLDREMYWIRKSDPSLIYNRQKGRVMDYDLPK